ncbi:5-formyltetrahydrofolate cyclo-ligase [Aestuariispira insulae]|uniref:5-formyltetrahydrofolate cyclo-ligase n=1 Tax=Aestuariispira insulae TaxID=1461337 RepID=A0A3D9HK29_9PROT|nr:5-formyltetrahydrofolate cyclo-ligase [Aestuariispira insulae]RED49775.1 5-formyltetrahydrofolate cyclo-ligase [Aestuariispira insulae]
MDLVEIKKQARKDASAKRKQAFNADDGSAMPLLETLFFDAVQPAPQSVISGFLPIGSEVDLRALLGHWTANGGISALPCVVGNDQPLLFREWREGDVLIKESFGTVAPGEDAPEHDPDILLVPMLAFDRAGYRLGYGGGFYDRTLEKLRSKKQVLAVGVAYAAQEVDAVPRDHHDQPLDLIVTEREVIRS